MFYINTVLCPIKVNSNTIEVTMHTSCYCVSDLLYVTSYLTHKNVKNNQLLKTIYLVSLYVVFTGS